jgi:hypothetical protein
VRESSGDVMEKAHTGKSASAVVHATLHGAQRGQLLVG